MNKLPKVDRDRSSTAKRNVPETITAEVRTKS